MAAWLELVLVGKNPTLSGHLTLGLVFRNLPPLTMKYKKKNPFIRPGTGYRVCKLLIISEMHTYKSYLILTIENSQLLRNCPAGNG